MAKIIRATQNQFASAAGTNQIAEYGSLAAGSPARYNGSTITAAIVQGLSNFLDGWFGAVVGQNAPAIEDMNALFWLVFYQIRYLFQEGIPEYDAGTTYYIGSRANFNNVIYYSVIDNNLGNAPSFLNQTNWRLDDGKVKTITGSNTGVLDDCWALIRCTHTGGSINFTLPAVATVPIGYTISIKNLSSDGSTVVVVGTIDGATNLTLNSTPVFDSVTLKNNGTDFDLV